MKEQFENWKPSPDTIIRLRQILAVLAEYKKMGIRLTLRQLYYQLVSKDLIPNEQKEYKNLGSILARARLAGLVDWDVIEDRVRQPDKASEWDDIQDLVKSAIAAYRLPRWSDQDNYVELWCEKDALRSVIDPITEDLHVTLMVNRGYSSISAMYASSKRLLKALESGKNVHILYLGDFDPSGEDMVRDIKTRMKLLRADGSDDIANENDDGEKEYYPRFMDEDTGSRLDLTVTKIALTPAQIARYKPPRNPAKTTDSRYDGFADKHGDSSYEVDALPPQVLMALVRKSIEDLMDMEKYEAWKVREEEEKKSLIKAAAKI
jgi:hypothetical protein